MAPVAVLDVGQAVAGVVPVGVVLDAGQSGRAQVVEPSYCSGTRQSPPNMPEVAVTRRSRPSYGIAAVEPGALHVSR